MKHGKRLTIRMKELLKKNGLNPDDYLYIKNQPRYLTVLNINTNKTEVLYQNN